MFETTHRTSSCVTYEILEPDAFSHEKKNGTEVSSHQHLAKVRSCSSPSLAVIGPSHGDNNDPSMSPFWWLSEECITVTVLKRSSLKTKTTTTTTN